MSRAMHDVLSAALLEGSRVLHDMLSHLPMESSPSNVHACTLYQPCTSPDLSLRHTPHVHWTL